MLKYTLITLLTFLVIPIDAADINDLFYDSRGETVIITECQQEASGYLVIPETIEGKLVTSIGYGAFSNCSSLTNITIPDGVTSIGDFAFNGCTSLTGITIPDSVTSIGSWAFHNCTSLTNITIPDRVTSIGDFAFNGCTSLTGITIPDNVTSIGSWAFEDCSNLTSITIPDSVTSIGSRAFENCTSLTSITIPKNVTDIGALAFQGCKELRIINFLGDSPPVNSPVIISDSPRAAIRIKPNATGFGEVFGGLPIIDPDSITSIQSVELDTQIEQFPDGNGGIHNVKVTVKVRSDIPVEFVTKSLNGTTGTIYENEIVNQFEKGQFPDGESQPDIWIFEWKDSIPSSASKETYAYSKISVTNFDGITTEYWPDITFSNDEILPPPLTRPIEFDGNYANWEFTETNKGYGFFADEDFPHFMFNATGDISSFDVTNADRFDHLPFEDLFGNADFVESNRLQCFGNGTALFNIVFSDTVTPSSLGIAVTDIDLENVIVRAWHKGEPIDKTTINRWFRELFDSSGNTNKPSWDPEYNAVVAQRDGDGLLSEEQFTGSGTESPSAWFFPDSPFDSLSLEYHNRIAGRSSMHVYLASIKEPDIINAEIKLESNKKVQISFPIEVGENYFIKRSSDLRQWDVIEENITSDSKWATDLNLIFTEKQPKKAFVPTEDIGNSWISLDYDDSSWMDVEKLADDGFTTIRGGVGFARSGTRVDPFDPFIALDLEEQMYGKNTSVYIRIPFIVEDLSAFKSLVLGARTDDGFVAWLNGELVQSFKAPDPIQWNSEATAINSDSIALTIKDYSLTQHLNKLKVGKNILAIQALNKGKSGSDFLFSCLLSPQNQRFIFSKDYPVDAKDYFFKILKQ